ncbi:hypothetical protein Tco_0303442 [Tanacetum coccineum]
MYSFERLFVSFFYYLVAVDLEYTPKDPYSDCDYFWGVTDCIRAKVIENQSSDDDNNDDDVEKDEEDEEEEEHLAPADLSAVPIDDPVPSS